MTSPLHPSRRRADEFARLLEGGSALALGTTDPVLAPLVGLAQALRSVPLGPSPDFQAGLRQRLVAVASIQFAGAAVAVPAAARPSTEPLTERLAAWAVSWRGQRRLTIATAGVAAVVLVGGIGIAGSRSLPGDPFYGVKRSTERAQLALTFGTEAKGERHLQFARERLDEVERMVGDTQALHAAASPTGYSVLAARTPQLGGSLTSRVISTLAAMDAETRQGTKDLTSVYNSTHESHPLETLQTFTREQFTGLRNVYAALPAGAKPAAAESARLVITVAKHARTLLGMQTCTDACASGGSPQGKGRRPGGSGSGPTTGGCTCTNPPGGTGGTPTTPDQTGATPHPTLTPGPGTGGDPSGNGGNGGDGGGGTGGTNGPGGGPQPSPTKSTLQDQIGGILSQLPIPSLSPPALPGPPLPPVLPKVSPLPTIHLP